MNDLDMSLWTKEVHCNCKEEAWIIRQDDPSLMLRLDHNWGGQEFLTFANAAKASWSRRPFMDYIRFTNINNLANFQVSNQTIRIYFKYCEHKWYMLPTKFNILESNGTIKIFIQGYFNQKWSPQTKGHLNQNLPNSLKRV